MAAIEYGICKRCSVAATINYPSRNFLRTALKTLRAGEDLAIYVASGWRRAILEKELPALPASALEVNAAPANGKRPPSFRMSLLLMPLSIVHHFALSGDFLLSFRKTERGMTILYSR
jgi:hypothetical protein